MKIKKLLDNLTSKITNAELQLYIKNFYSYLPVDYQDIFSLDELEIFASRSYEFIKSYNGTRNVEFEKIDFPKERILFHIIGPNKPFIVDSLKILLAEQNISFEFFLHPIGSFKQRNIPISNDGANSESVICIAINSNNISIEKAEKLKEEIYEILKQVDVTYDSWASTLNLLEESKNFLIKTTNSQNTQEYISFLEWIKNDNFTFLGCVDYNPNSKLITTKSGYSKIWGGDKKIIELLSLINFLNSDKLIEFGKLTQLSKIHRNNFIDYIIVKNIDQNNLISIRIYLGLYSHNLDYQSVRDIPILRDKLSYAISQSNFSPQGYNSKKFKIIIESLPRGALFHIDREELYDLCLKTLSGMSVNSLKLFQLGGCKNNFIELIIFINRKRFTPETHQKIHEYLKKTFDIDIIRDYINEIGENFVFLYSTFVSEKCNQMSQNSAKAIEHQLERITYMWEDELINLIKNQLDEKQSQNIITNYSMIFPSDYQYNHKPEEALRDIGNISNLNPNKKIIFELAHSGEDLTLRLFSSSGKHSLSNTMPLLENLGFTVLEEQSYKLKNLDNYFLHIYIIKSKGEIDNFLLVKNLVENALYAILEHKTTADSLSKLITYSQISWRDIDLLRAISHFLHQVGFSYDNNYVYQTLIKHSEFTKKLVKLFDIKFNPKISDKSDIITTESELKEYLANVSSSAEDKVLRSLLGIINSSLRTNYYQIKNGEFKNYISIKYKSSIVPAMPKPMPYAEIFVYAKDFEAIHLRGGKVARGGLRWSDRGEDYRTEVLGLMKAQMTKNAVIVPVGSKGGFFTKFTQDEISREEYLSRAVECYKNFLRGLLDITDNIESGEIKSPEDCVIYDDKDPYLVVAADKGTATFSDYANSVSKEYNFWLGDAFASGGSAGYDHKKMGITAKGAWISVQRHFKEIGIDVQKDHITVVGIGDMSGDVFGNGLLMSDSVKLVAAFNHIHIFIDPAPDPLSSFNERKRLFNLPTSKWTDYNPALISQGGGVFDRKAKLIKVSKEMSDLLDIKEQEIAPEDLIKHILKANIDLIWNGGIGTYIKASSEENYTIGDKGNDILRVNGKDVRAKVIGEGGNLGMSQLGRIEYAKNGGRLNTDFIDNSGGVDCSDHEVNMKIAFGKALENKKIDLLSRDKILSEMTNQVSDLVLEDNKYQTLAISIMQNSSLFTVELFTRLIDILESEKLLERNVEFIPSNQELAQRANQGGQLTRPELAVLLSYSKRSVYNELESSKLAYDQYFSNWLLSYFPEMMREKFKDEILNHPLRKEIILTMITNRLVNQLSGPILSSLKRETGALLCDIVRGFVIVQEIFNLNSIWDEVDKLNSTVPLNLIMEIYTDLNKVIRRGIAWMITNLEHPLKITDSINLYKESALKISNMLTKNLYGSAKEKYEMKYAKYLESGIPADLSEKCAGLESLVSSFDISFICKDTKADPELVSSAYFKIGNQYSVDWLRKTCDKLMTESYWQRLSIQSLKDDLYDKQRRLIKLAINDGMIHDLDKWYQKNHQTSVIYNNFVEDLKNNENIDISMLILANKKLEIFIRKI